MALFDLFKKKTEDYGIDAVPGKVYAPISGDYIPLESIDDPVFSQGIMGPGCGIEPSEGILVAPVDGTVVTVAETKHAVGIEARNGAELLIHVGMDTVNMKGNGFELKVSEGDKVRCGQPLMHFDMNAIKAAGYPTTTAFVVTNSDAFPSVALNTGKSYQRLEEIGTVEA